MSLAKSLVLDYRLSIKLQLLIIITYCMVESFSNRGPLRRNELARHLISQVGLVSALFTMLSAKEQIVY